MRGRTELRKEESANTFNVDADEVHSHVLSSAGPQQPHVIPGTSTASGSSSRQSRALSNEGSQEQDRHLAADSMAVQGNGHHTAMASRDHEMRDRRARMMSPDRRPSEDASEDECACCCEAMATRGVGECGHTGVCGICTLRLRQLLDETSCIVCMQPLGQIVISATRTRENAQNTRGLMLDPDGSGCFFDDEEEMQRMLDLRRISCKICAPEGHEILDAYSSLNELQSHLKSDHAVSICELCATHRHVFPREQVLYTDQQLWDHMEGQGGEMGAVHGHPMCRLCSPPTRLWDDVELFRHMVGLIVCVSNCSGIW